MSFNQSQEKVFYTTYFALFKDTTKVRNTDPSKSFLTGLSWRKVFRLWPAVGADLSAVIEIKL